MDELLLITGLAPLLETNLRVEPCEKLYTTDASPGGAGGCAASITQDDWFALCDLAEEDGEHARLDWKGDRFSKGKHINLLELERLISLLRPVTRAGCTCTSASGAVGFTSVF